MATTKQKVLFYWMPRTGGTSIMKAMSGMFGSEPQQLLAKNPRQFDPSAHVVSFGHIHLNTLIERGILTQQDLDERFIFAFVRDPPDRLVSLYRHFRHLNEHLPPWPEWLDTITHRTIPWPGSCNRCGWSMANPQSRWLDGHRIDFMGSHHNLVRDWARLCDHLGWPEEPLGHRNRSSGSHYPTECYYDGAMLDAVRQAHAADYELAPLQERIAYR